MKRHSKLKPAKRTVTSETVTSNIQKSKDKIEQINFLMRKAKVRPTFATVVTAYYQLIENSAKKVYSTLPKGTKIQLDLDDVINMTIVKLKSKYDKYENNRNLFSTYIGQMPIFITYMIRDWEKKHFGRVMKKGKRSVRKPVLSLESDTSSEYKKGRALTFEEQQYNIADDVFESENIEGRIFAEQMLSKIKKTALSPQIIIILSLRYGLGKELNVSNTLKRLEQKPGKVDIKKITDALTRVDMGEKIKSENIAKYLGVSPSYVSHLLRNWRNNIKDSVL